MREEEKRIMRRRVLFLPLITIICVSLLAPNRATAQTDPVMGTDPLPSTAPVSVSFDINITITDAVNITGWEFNMTFDPTVLNVDTITAGVPGYFLYDFAIPAGVFPWFVFDPAVDIDNTNGWTHAACTLFPVPDPVDGADGDGVLATVTFTVMSEGNSDLHFVAPPTMLRTTDPVDKIPVEVPHTTEDGFFQYPQGDVTNDGIVDTNDLDRIDDAYGACLGDSNWDEDCDLNKDDVTDVYDLILCSKNYGAGT